MNKLYLLLLIIVVNNNAYSSNVRTIKFSENFINHIEAYSINEFKGIKFKLKNIELKNDSHGNYMSFVLIPLDELYNIKTGLFVEDKPEFIFKSQKIEKIYFERIKRHLYKLIGENHLEVLLNEKYKRGDILKGELFLQQFQFKEGLFVEEEVSLSNCINVLNKL